MTPRLIIAQAAALLFVLAGFTAMNEATSVLRMAYLWFGLACAASVVVLGLPRDDARG